MADYYPGMIITPPANWRELVFSESEGPAETQDVCACGSSRRYIDTGNCRDCGGVS